MVINPVCYSWICEIPCGARLPLKLVTEFVTEFCDRTRDQIVTNFPVKSSCTLLNTTGSCFILLIIISFSYIVIKIGGY